MSSPIYEPEPAQGLSQLSRGESSRGSTNEKHFAEKQTPELHDDYDLNAHDM